MNNINKINNFFKKKEKNILKYLNIKKKYILKFDKKEKDILFLYDINKNKIEFKYIFYGIISNKEFIWANNIYGINNENIINKINEIKENKRFFKNKNDKVSKFYYNLLNNNRIKLNKNEEIEMINKLLIYLNNDLYFLNPVTQNSIQIIGLNKIVGKYY